MKIALSYAMAGEIESILPSGAEPLETIAGVPFYAIDDNMIACCDGIGKVNAAMATQLCIDRYRPDLILNAGVAGSFQDLPIGTIVLADSLIQHDVDTSPIGDPVGLVSTVNRLEFPVDRLPLAEKLLKELGVSYVTGKVASGDVFMVKGDRADWVARTFSPTLCEMEGCAVAQVCLRNGVDFLALKSVSDRLCMDNSPGEYFNFAQAMEKLNAVVLPLARTLRDAAAARSTTATTAKQED